MEVLKCPYCGSSVDYAPASRVYKRDGFGFLFLCRNYPKCDSYVSAGEDGKPTGTLANKELREQRKTVYKVMDEFCNTHEVRTVELFSLMGRFHEKKLWRINDLEAKDACFIVDNIEAFKDHLHEVLYPVFTPQNSILIPPLRYLFFNGQTGGRGINALPYEKCREHLKMLKDATKCGAVCKITKLGTRQIHFILTKAGRNFINC
jgi:ssDNA-binding Zn-finger/Zn-ribbon topoisomerase 1